jgi:hypothetical protein
MPAQSRKFIEAAKKLGVDEDGKASRRTSRKPERKTYEIGTDGITGTATNGMLRPER